MSAWAISFYLGWKIWIIVIVGRNASDVEMALSAELEKKAIRKSQVPVTRLWNPSLLASFNSPGLLCRNQLNIISHSLVIIAEKKVLVSEERPRVVRQAEWLKMELENWFPFARRRFWLLTVPPWHYVWLLFLFFRPGECSNAWLGVNWMFSFIYIYASFMCAFYSTYFVALLSSFSPHPDRIQHYFRWPINFDS